MNDFKPQLREVNGCKINFKELQPISVFNSLHIYEERYEIDNETYILSYAIGYDSDPKVEILVKDYPSV